VREGSAGVIRRSDKNGGHEGGNTIGRDVDAVVSVLQSQAIRTLYGSRLQGGLSVGVNIGGVSIGGVLD
jgi:hypothetical protein